MTTATKAPKPTEAERFDYAGETIEVSPQVGYQLIARYRQAASALTAAKAEALKIEEEIKTLMGGHEHLVIDGTQVAHYIWKDLTSFDKKGLKAKYPDVVAEFTVTKENGSRAFTVPGTSGVE